MGKYRQISRRTVLRGVGAAIALPWLESIMPRLVAGGRRRTAAAHGLFLGSQRHAHARLDAEGRRPA